MCFIRNVYFVYSYIFYVVDVHIQIHHSKTNIVYYTETLSFMMSKEMHFKDIFLEDLRMNDHAWHLVNGAHMVLTSSESFFNHRNIKLATRFGTKCPQWELQLMMQLN